MMKNILLLFYFLLVANATLHAQNFVSWSNEKLTGFETERAILGVLEGAEER